jgi:hypothetical protein
LAVARKGELPVKDDKGLYYYPFPQNKNVRMYVRREGGEVAFRMWNRDDPELWEAHGWVPYTAIRQAAAMFKGKPFDPKRAYDVDAAEALLAEHPEP